MTIADVVEQASNASATSQAHSPRRASFADVVQRATCSRAARTSSRSGRSAAHFAKCGRLAPCSWPAADPRMLIEIEVTALKPDAGGMRGDWRRARAREDRGRVQGVGFRAFVEMNAAELGSRLGAQSPRRVGRGGIPGPDARRRDAGRCRWGLRRRRERRDDRRRRRRFRRLRGAPDGLRLRCSGVFSGLAPQALEDRLVGLLVARLRIDHVDGIDELARPLGWRRRPRATCVRTSRCGK